MADNRKFLDQDGLVTLVQRLNTRYEGLYFHKADFSAEKMAFQHDNLNGGKDTTVKEALTVLVENVVRQVNDAAVFQNNMQAVETKVDANAAAIAKLNGDANTTGSVAKAVKDAIDTEVTRVDKKIADDIAAQAVIQKTKDDAQDEAIAAINEQLGNEDFEGGSIAGAISAVQGEVDAVEGRMDTAEGEIDALQQTVAKLDGAVDVEGSVKKQIKDAVDAQKAIQEAKDGKQDAAIAAKVAQTAYDTKVAELVAEDERIAGLVASEEARAKGIEEGLQSAINAINNETTGILQQAKDYADQQDTVDKTAQLLVDQEQDRRLDAIEAAIGEDGGLEARVAANEDAIEVIKGTGEGSIKKAVADLVDGAPEALDTLNELAAALRDNANVLDAVETAFNGKLATLQADVDQNEADCDAAIAAEKSRAEGQEAAIRQEFAAADTALHTTISAEIDADVAAEAALREAADTALQAAVDAKVAQADYDAKVEDFEDRIAANEAFVAAQPAKDDGQDERIAALEAVVDVEGESVDAKIAAAQTAAEGKAEAAKAAADQAQEDVDALEEVVGAPEDDAEASTVFGAIAKEADDREAADNAIKGRLDALEAIDHDHDNKAVLDGITAEKVVAWDAAEQNAKNYVDTEIAKITALTDGEIEAAIGQAFGETQA